MFRFKKGALLLAASLAAAHVSPVYAQEDPLGLDWPGLYDPFRLIALNLELIDSNGDGSNADEWTTIVNDSTYDIELPAVFWADGDDTDPILVSVRRKSAELLGGGELGPPAKVSLKVDINEYTADEGVCDAGYEVLGATCVKTWHGVKKLSLENGDDNNVITEGLAWYLHTAAAESDLSYRSGRAAWVTVTVNGESKGVYVNVEQPDKQYLKNRDMWVGDDTWLYKYSDIDSPEIKEYPEDLSPVEFDSPLYDELCYLPFQTTRPCAEPADFKDRLNATINMEGLLTFGAVTAFQGSPDDLYAKDKNFYFVDYTTPETGLREYLEWDLDSAFNGNKSDASIYSQGKGKSDVYEEALVEASNAPFRAEYDAIMRRLLDGPFNEGDLHAAFDDMAAVIGEAVDADPNNQLGQDAAGTFANLKAFVSARIASVESQLPAPPPPPLRQVSITNPSDGDTVSGELTVTAVVTDPGGDGVDSVEFFARDIVLGTDGNGDDGWSFPWDTTSGVDGTADVSATATYSDGDTATDTIGVTVNNAPGTLVTVGGLIPSSVQVHRKGNWKATVAVTVAPAVPGIEVSGSWTGGFTGTGACTTNASGTCSLTSGTINKNQTSVIFTVVGLAGDGYSYDPSGPSSVAVSKP